MREDAHRRTCEIRETKDKGVIEDIEMIAYVNDMKLKQHKECFRGEALMKQERAYQQRCRDELDATHMHEREIYDLYEIYRKPIPPLDDKMFSMPDSS